MKDILLVIAGGAIGCLSAIALEYYKELLKRKKARANILSEIKLNKNYIERDEYLHLQWQIYELYLEYLSAYSQEQTDRIITFYAKVKRHKFLGDEFRSKNKHGINYQLSLDGVSNKSRLEEDKAEIVKLGTEILESEGKQVKK